MKPRAWPGRALRGPRAQAGLAIAACYPDLWVWGTWTVMLNMGETEPGLQSDLIDISGIDLEQLSAMPGTVFAIALRRILHQDPDDSVPYAGFLNDRPAD